MRRSILSLALVVTLAGCSAAPSSDAPPSTRGTASPSSSVLPTTGTTSASPAAHPSTSPPADPEANPTSTAHVSTAGLRVAPVLSGATTACRSGNPLANVYHPYRLQVVARCSTVGGVVTTVRHEDDGDYHIDIALDPAYRQMLNAASFTYQHGWLVLEIVPADQPGCTVGRPPRPASGTYDFGICTGADETPPSVGQHIWATGPYVIDLWHDWTEIHPVWSITRTKPTSTTAASSPTPKPTASTSPSPSPSRAMTCSASMSDATPRQYSTTTVVVHTAAGANVSATAHYKSTDTTNTGAADSSGVAQIPFKISRATLGYTVVVDVTAAADGRTATCSTSFTPR